MSRMVPVCPSCGSADIPYAHDCVPATHVPAGDPRFLAALEEVRSMHLRKSSDYGSSLTGDPLANIRASEDYGIPAWVGAMIRAGDKTHRIKEFARKGVLANESVRDSLLDLAAYSLIALVLYDELSDSETQE